MIDTISDKIVEVFSVLIVGIFDFILEPLLGIDTLEDLVFGNTDSADFVWGVFNSTVYNDGFTYFYNTAWTFALVVFAGLIVVYGINVSLKFGTPQGRVEAYQNGFLIFLVGFLIMTIPMFYDILFDLNKVIIQFFNTSHENIISSEDIEAGIGNAVGRILIELVVVGLAVWANFYYLMRGLTLFILLGLGPIFLVMLINPSLRGLTTNWMKETISSIFIQSIHAMVYWILTIFTLTTTNIVTTVIAFVVFIPVTIMVRSLFGINPQAQDGLNRAGAAFGMSSLMAMGGAIKGAANGKSLSEVASDVVGNVRDKIDQSRGMSIGDVKDTVQGKDGSDLAAEKNANRLLRNGERLKNIGKGVFGSFGAVAGSGLGPMGSFAGANIASLIGGEASGIIGRTGTAAMDRLKERKNRMDNLFKPVGSAEDIINGPQSLSEDVQNTAEALAENDAHKWAEKNKDEIMSDLKNRFPNASEGELKDLLEQEVASRKGQLTTQYQDELSKLIERNETVSDLSKDDINSLKQSLFNKWEDNGGKKAFEDEYREQHPQQDGESNEAYQQRMGAAYQQHANGMKEKIGLLTNSALKNARQSTGLYNHAQVAQDLNQSLVDEGIVPADSKMVTDTVNGFQKNALLTNDGRLDYKKVSDALIQNAVMKDKNSFIQSSMALGANREEAEHDWKRNHEAQSIEANTLKFDKGAYMQQGQIADKAAFIDTQTKGGITPAQATANWETSGQEQAYKKLQHTAQQDQAVISSIQADRDAYVAQKVANGETREQALSNWQSSGQMEASSRKHIQSFVDDGMKNEKAAFVQQLKGSNVPETEANELWMQSGQERSYKKHDAAFNDVSQLQHGTVIPASVQNIPARTFANQLRAFQITAKDDISDFASTVKGIASAGVQQATVHYSDSLETGNNVLTAAGGAVLSGFKGASNAFVNRAVDVHGSAVDAQKDFVDNAGYIGGVFLGKSGHALATGFATKFTPFSDGVQNEIRSASEIIQMAQKTTNSQGLTEIVPGAIRQVVSNQGSYIEVLTDTGARQQVSRITGGHANLADGEVVYQDLAVQNGMLTAVKRGTHETYRQLADGSIMPSDVAVSQNPNTLIKQKVNIPQLAEGALFTENSGIYSPNEVYHLAARNTEGEVAPGAIRQVTTPKESYIEVLTSKGTSHIVSRKREGDSSLLPGETVFTNLEVKDNAYSIVGTRIGDEIAQAYVMDTAGGFVKRNLSVMDPNVFNSALSADLQQLKNTQSFIKGKEYPVFNHQVDTGQFFTEDIVNNGVENMRMIVENNRRFVVGDRNGTTYRISRVTAGDMRVGDNEVHQIDLQLDGQSLKPIEYINEKSNVVASLVQRIDKEGLQTVKGTYSSAGLDKAVISQLMLHIMASQDLRKQVSAVRQPQSMAN